MKNTVAYLDDLPPIWDAPLQAKVNAPLEWFASTFGRMPAEPARAGLCHKPAAFIIIPVADAQAMTSRGQIYTPIMALRYGDGSQSHGDAIQSHRDAMQSAPMSSHTAASQSILDKAFNPYRVLRKGEL